MTFKWLNQQLEVYIKTEIMTAVSCSVPTVTSNILKCWLAIWFCFMSLSIRLIDLPSLSVACGWSSQFTVWAYNMTIVQWCDYSIWSLCGCSCGASSYAFADCSRDWAVYVRDALEESDLSEGMCNWVTAKDSSAEHIHCMSTCIVFTEKKKIGHLACVHIMQSVCFCFDKMTDEWASLFEFDSSQHLSMLYSTVSQFYINVRETERSRVNPLSNISCLLLAGVLPDQLPTCIFKQSHIICWLSH